ncbi:envelope stress response membrane protein PspB [Thioalkalivibrio sp. XN279]|uniref:envelope stress response membrane protein PspB n=1 Tax=Thioalkalivibrio sp. XN279 TaxID=2714953 RepID=UPI0014073726|nr:envelope stress response membrane protein PspB [Thioalkalivibrio sp. XN279]NHA13844.1 envelope stress response membrane protein PspB [Thioalkalivibrio sp. XN279]
MSEFIGAFMIIIAAVVLPLVVILHYVTKWKSSRTLSGDEQRMLEDLWQDAQKMESRINALETILDDRVPDWRKRT